MGSKEDSRPAKQQKVEQQAPAANVILQFQSPDGDTTGPQLDVPQDVTPGQLETLLNGLLQNEERLPYSFFVEDAEVAAELGQHLLKNKVSVEAVLKVVDQPQAVGMIMESEVSVEAVLKVVYQPQAVFRVRSVARCSATIPGHAEAVLSVNFSPDGKRLASGSGDTTVRFWDLNTQTPLFTCKGHTSWVLVVAWSPDAQLVASGDHSGSIYLWDPATGQAVGQCRARQRQHASRAAGGRERRLRRPPAAQLAASGNRHCPSPLLACGHRKFITSLAWEPAHVELPCRRFCSGSKDATIKVWEAATRWQQQQQQQQHQQQHQQQQQQQQQQ
ncbi:hypothetical protein N2152v2_000835 [Parachlorella kessleri]